MLEIITGVVLAASAGLNAYVPLLGLGLLSRFTEWVSLPTGWSWIENEWSLGILGVLLVIGSIWLGQRSNRTPRARIACRKSP